MISEPEPENTEGNVEYRKAFTRDPTKDDVLADEMEPGNDSLEEKRKGKKRRSKKEVLADRSVDIDKVRINLLYLLYALVKRSK